jgi:acyl-CoA synthetase (AMP-forming)/AMP-acid ligase II
LGERVKACVIPREPGSLTAQDIKDYLKDRIAKYKIPEYVEFMTEFPMNATGKVRCRDEGRESINGISRPLIPVSLAN